MIQKNSNININIDAYMENAKNLDSKSAKLSNINTSKFKNIFNKEVSKENTNINEKNKLTEIVELEEDSKTKENIISLLAQILSLLNMANEKLEDVDTDVDICIDDKISEIKDLISILEINTIQDLGLESINDKLQEIQVDLEKTFELVDKELIGTENPGVELTTNPILEKNEMVLENNKGISKVENNNGNINIETLNIDKVQENEQIQIDEKVIDEVDKNLFDKKQTQKNGKIESAAEEVVFEEDVQIEVVKSNPETEVNIFNKSETKDVLNIKTDKATEELVSFSNLEQIEKNVVDQIVSKMEFKLEEGKNQVIVQLKPEALGKMKMDLEIENNSIVAKFIVDNHKTKEIVENNIAILQEKLEENGMKIKTVEVFVGNNSDFDQNENSRGFNFFNKENNKQFKPKKNKLTISKDYESTIVEESSSKTVDLIEGMNLFA